jgi:flagellar M-ring protein FliF
LPGAAAVSPSGGGAAAALPAPDDPGIDVAQIGGRVKQSSVKKMAEVVSQHPDESAQIIRGWLNNAL